MTSVSKHGSRDVVRGELVSLFGLLSKMSQTEGLKSKLNFILTILEAEKSKIKVRSDLVSDENFLSSCRRFLLVCHQWWKG